ncbi:hypothetical protein RDWZM_003580 [Blomia tropicalis]|uniref:Glycogen debranching enzyme n=1 Tax=Blomia tropicalis TaxID=40697 RepID=A0A9Q0MJS2_BLOTA|nr:hypothetical protein RDWZM_003580 [Blomia tropicalis]
MITLDIEMTRTSSPNSSLTSLPSVSAPDLDENKQTPKKVSSLSWCITTTIGAVTQCLATFKRFTQFIGIQLLAPIEYIILWYYAESITSADDTGYQLGEMKDKEEEETRTTINQCGCEVIDFADVNNSTTTMHTLLRSHLLSSKERNDEGQTNVGRHGISNDQLVLIYNLELNSFNESKLFRCDKFNRIRFHLGPSLYGRKIVLLTNYNEDYTQFHRNTYIQVSIDDAHNVLQLRSSGTFHFTYTDMHSPKIILGSFYIVVNPELSIYGNESRAEENVSINAIQCQTVLAKCMGPIDSWKDKLKVTTKSGYNMIHWTPVQELGASRSAYSLANQHRINPEFRTQTMIDKQSECLLSDIVEIVNDLRLNDGVLSITDIVLNHTANESLWLKEHPEAAYNCANSPWLRPAFLLDQLFWHLTLDIIDGRWKSHGLTTEVNTEQHLDIIRQIFINEYLPMIKFDQYYICDEENLISKFEQFLFQSIYGDEVSKDEIKTVAILNHPGKQTSNNYNQIELIQDPEYRRLASSIDFDNALNLIINEVQFVGDLNDRDALTRWIDFALLFLADKLNSLNQIKRDQIKDHLKNAIENVIKGVRYERIDPSGPKISKVSLKRPLTTKYFVEEIDEAKYRDLIYIEESLYDASKSCFYMAHNGWVMGDDPLRNFAEENSLVYLRRELVCWGDSVKLRYGKTPEDSPFLWKFMCDYVTQMASSFHGLRLDNCHSTPIHVAKFMLDAARRVNPDLYLIAELFTSNEEIDNVFVNKLGIISLIREAMSASTPFELGRQVYRFGGEPAGSFQPDNLKTSDKHKDTLFMRPFVPTVAHAIFFDLTHDNESPIVRRTAFDPLASSALVSMTYSAIGSNRGLDELVPHHINVVNEERQYSPWDETGKDGVNFTNGIIDGKCALNQLHQFLGTNGYSQSYVDQRDRDTVVVTRHNPKTHKSVILAARTAFYPLHESYASSLKPLRIEGRFEKILFEMHMTGQPDDNFERHENRINGYHNFNSNVRLMIDSNQSEMIDLNVIENLSINSIEFKNFPPSSVIAFSVGLLDCQVRSVEAIQAAIEQCHSVSSEIIQIINQFDLIDLNYIIFRSNQEEMDETGNGAYSLSTGPFVYCGLAGIIDGDWLPQYIVARLKRRSSTIKLAQWLENVFGHLSQLPRYLIPRYFDSILLPIYTLLLEQIWAQSSDFVRHGDDFVRRLTFGGLAMIGSHFPSPLPPLASKSIPASLSHLSGAKLPTLAAGLPHFASGYMRNWGRDTFIALKGLTLLTGHFDVAKVIIIGFAGTLRHGLIPNLLDGGRNSRYNCRDAVWWWLQAIKDYIQIVPDGHLILNEQVRRIFPTDDSPALTTDNDRIELQPLHKTIQEALERHFVGIEFTERNAGTKIDAHMTTEGFNIKIGVDRNNGFVYGGNQWNCGTWMDKMGSSDKAKNRGHPATPRDGSPVEIVGLCKSVITFLAELHHKKIYPYEGVCSSEENWTFEQWSNKIQENFEMHFYINHDCNDEHVNRRQIYKDTFGATKRWMDYQLRPNFVVAMCVAPELFVRDHAIEALKMVDQHLLGPMGMKTLDPSDWNYRGDYDNSNDSDDYSVANGFNYHNGPEWLWPTGYYLMARLKFNTNHSQEVSRVSKLLSKHYDHITQSIWFGLPELTNSNGSYCHHSCPIQAWSHGTMLELLHLKLFIERNMIE